MPVEQGSRSGSDYRALTGFVVGRQHGEPGIKGSDEDRSAERSNVRQFDMLDDHRLVSCSFCDKSWCVNLKKAASSWDSSILAELVNSWAVVGTPGIVWRLTSRVIAIPLIAALSYEALRLGA